MTRTNARIAVAAAFFLMIAATPCLAKPGLLLVAHGSPRAEWNKPVMDLGEAVAKEALAGGDFLAVRTAMLEFTEPSIPTAVAELEAAGCDSIIAVPLFIAPSGHSLFDVPTVLGILHTPETAAVIAEEGGAVARPKVPIRMTGTFSSGDLLERFAASAVKNISNDPENEAVVFLLHGDENHGGLIESRMRRIVTHCCGKAGIGHGDWAGVAVGQEYVGAGTAAIDRALAEKKRVLVVGVYVSLTAKKIHDRAEARLQHHAAGNTLFEGDRVVFSEDALIGHPDTPGWILEIAKSAL